MKTEDFRVDAFLNRSVYTLPKRELPETRLYGWSAIAVGTSTSIAVIVSMVRTILPGIQAVQQNNSDGWVNIAFGLSGILWLMGTLAILAGGIAVAFNQTYCTIELKTNTLITRERFWFVSWKRSLRLDLLKRLTVTADNHETEFDDGDSEQPTLISLNPVHWLGQWRSSLIAHTGDAEVAIALAYPHDFLLRLAHHLAPRLDAKTSTIVPRIERTRIPTARTMVGGIEIVDEVLLQEIPRDSFKGGLPEGSQLQIERRDDGVTITAPPRRGWKTIRLPLLFITIFITVASIQFRPRNGIIPPKLFMIFAVGGVMFAVFLWVASRIKTTLSTDGKSLRIRSTSWLHRSTKEWSRGTIYEIKTALKSVIDYTSDPYELQIHAVGEEPHCCLQQLSQKELKWITAQLCTSLDITPDRLPESLFRDELDRPIPPPKSDFSINYDEQRTILRVPPASFSQRAILTLVLTLGLFQTLLFLTIFLVPKPWQMVAAVTCLIAFVVGGFGVLLGCVLTRKSCVLTVTRDKLLIQCRGIREKSETVIERDMIQPLKVTESFHRLNPSAASYEIVICKKPLPDSEQKTIAFEHQLLKERDRDDLTFVATAINEFMDLTDGRD